MQHCRCDWRRLAHYFFVPLPEDHVSQPERAPTKVDGEELAVLMPALRPSLRHEHVPEGTL